MAVVNIKSGPITNRDASPRVLSNASVARGIIKGFKGVVAVGNGDNINSKYFIGQIPSNAVVHKIRIDAPDIGTTFAVDVGLWNITGKDGSVGTVVDQDFFASAVSLATGPYVDLDVTYEAGAAGGNIANAEQMIWQMLGLASDPGVEYDVIATATAASDAAATMVISAQWAE